MFILGLQPRCAKSEQGNWGIGVGGDVMVCPSASGTSSLMSFKHFKIQEPLKGASNYFLFVLERIGALGSWVIKLKSFLALMRVLKILWWICYCFVRPFWMLSGNCRLEHAVHAAASSQGHWGTCTAGDLWGHWGFQCTQGSKEERIDERFKSQGRC